MNITLKVDTAVEVPVNAVPLTDDTDFKTRETGVAYNASGMDLVWNFLTTAGVISQTAVTPTTSGVYDWVHEGDGMYSMEIPASGGGSINNDTEGWGWFSGFVTGVLPFRGPTICFAPAHVVDGLVTGSDNLQVDSVQVSGDSTAADNLELMYDGTGYADDTAPASRAQVAAISSVGGSRSSKAGYDNTTRDTIDNAGAVDKGDGTVGIPVTGHSFTVGLEITITGSSNYDDSYEIVSATTNEIVITETFSSETFAGTETINSSVKGIEFVGTQSSGTFASTQSSDDTRNLIDDDTNEIDIVYAFDITAGYLPTGLNFEGFLNGSNDSLNVLVYDHVNTEWDNRGSISGKSGSTDDGLSFSFFDEHVGSSGNDLGFVYVRYQNTGQTNPDLNIDFQEVESIGDPSVGSYSGGAIYIDTNNGTAGTVVDYNGTDRRPVITLSDALTLNTTLGFNRFRIAAGSSITLTADSTDCDFSGESWTLAFGGQIITGCKISGADVSGTFVGSDAILENCIINTITGPGMVMRNCYLNEVTVTNNGTAGWYLNDCRSRIAGSGRATIDYGAAVANTGFSIRNYSGGLEFQNMGQSGTDTLSLEGFGNCVFNANCTGGSAEIRGCFTLTNSGSVNLGDDARYAVSRAAMNVFEAFYDAVLTDTVENGSSPTTTTFDGSGALDSSNDDIYNHCFVYFLTGDLAGVSRKVSDYDAGTSNFSFDGSTGELDAAWPIAPSADDEFMIIGLGE